MLSESKVPEMTPWFDGTVKPKHYGWYPAEVKVWISGTTTFFVNQKRLLYRNRVWWMPHRDHNNILIRTVPPIRWRGFVRPA